MSNTIESIDYFPAGYCTGHLSSMFSGVRNRKLTFPAGVFLIEHRRYGYILYDTGYHYDIKTKLRYSLYRLVTPVQMTRQDQIIKLLSYKGIRASDIRYVILSHLHPDHIGGAKFFPYATFILTRQTYDVYKHSGIKDLVFKGFLPSDFEERLAIVDTDQDYNELFPYKQSCKLFGGDDLLLVSVDGHAKGQACLYLPEFKLLIAADLCWGVDLIPYTSKLRLLPSLVQNDKENYIQGIEFLKTVMNDGIGVVVSHDPVERIESILHAKTNIS